MRLEGLGQSKKSNDVIGNRTRYLQAYNIVPQQTMLPRSLNTVAPVSWLFTGSLSTPPYLT
jgi:hypothetical protein